MRTNDAPPRFFDQLVGRKNRHWVPSTARPAVTTRARGIGPALQIYDVRLP